MSSREKILGAVTRNKPAPTSLPTLATLADEARQQFSTNCTDRFAAALAGVGGTLVPVADSSAIADYVRQQYSAGPHRLITTLPALSSVAEVNWSDGRVHDLADVELAIVEAQLGVVENGAVWLTEPLLAHRAVLFIAQHLGVVLRASDLVPTMHDAYRRIGQAHYGFGVFVAGPSKTADIEQSLVLGAHGPKTMTVFLLS